MNGFDQHREDEPSTGYGDPRVDAAVARTDGLEERAIAEHVEVFEEVHRRFRETLDDPGSSASGA